MTAEEIIRYVLSFLGGGMVASLLDWFRAYRSDKKAHKICTLEAQIHNLYGPLQFFASQNEVHFDLNKKILEAYQTEYERKNWSQDETTQKNVNKEASQTLGIANAYIKIVNANNESIFELLRKNYAYIDPEDIETFRQFVVDYTRLKTEVDDSGRLNTPLRIYNYIGDISFMRPDFIKMAKEKFNAKKKALDTLTS